MVSARFRKMVAVYAIFSDDLKNFLDFSDDKLRECYIVESCGGRCSDTNGYAIGKKLLNITVSMWKEDLKSGVLKKSELYQDTKFPRWWLDSVLKDMRL
jgi:hypothetical protein